MRANLQDQRGGQVGASPAAQGPIEQTGGRGTVTATNTPEYIRIDPKTVVAKYSQNNPGFAREFINSPSLAQRKYNIPQREFAALVNDATTYSGDYVFRDNSVMQNTQDWLYRNVAGGGSFTPEEMAENARQYGLNQKVDPNKPNPVDNKPVYPKGPGVTQPQPNTGASSGGKFNVTGSANQPNLTIASVSAKLPKGTNPMFVATAIRSNPSLAAKYGLTSSEARMLMDYYAQ